MLSELNELEIQIIRELQRGIPLEAKPYLSMSQKIGISEDELLSKINELIDLGIIRRLGAVVHHQMLGYTANAMVVLDVPDERTPAVGKLLAQMPEVTHCVNKDGTWKNFYPHSAVC